jgi:minor histocompatibility antigen H13
MCITMFMCTQQGLGDIVIPGIFIALLLRFDAHRANANPLHADGARFPKPFFHTALVSYIAGLGEQHTHPT